VALVARVSHRTIAARFGISSASVQRHGLKHLSPAQRAAIAVARRPSEIDLPALQRSESEALLLNLVAQRARLALAGEQAAERGNLDVVCRVEARVTANLELTGRLLDQFTVYHQVTNVSLLVSADYIKLRTRLVECLRAHPAAARDVARMLAELEQEAAAEITEQAARANGSAKLIEHRAEPEQIEQAEETTP
jgi:hypothetical protein